MPPISLGTGEPSSSRRKGKRDKDGEALATAGDVLRAGTPASDQSDTIRDPEQETRLKECLGLFELLFLSFRDEVWKIFGDSAEGILMRAEESVRSRLPDFDLSSSDPEKAVQVLDLFETVVKTAPFFKRSRLREVSLALVSELYTRNYELLEEFRGVEPLEQFYYRLKK
jgi:hypothetical protein